MRTAIALAILLALGVAGAAKAQPYQGPLFLGSNRLQTLSLSGVVSTLYSMPSGYHALDVTMDAANRNVFFSDRAAKGWMEIDVSTAAVTSIWSDPAIFDYPTKAVIDQNGDYILAGAGPWGVTGYGLYKLSGKTVTTIVTTLAMGVNGSFTGGLEIDIDTGNFLAQLYGGSSGVHPLISIAPDGTFTTITPNTWSTGARYQFAQDIRTGDLYVGSQTSALGLLVRVDKKTGASTTVAHHTDRYVWNAVHADRASSSLPRLITTSYHTKALYFTDLKDFTVTSVAHSGPIVVSPRSMEVIGSRNLQTVLTGKRTWDIQLSCPHHPSKAYAMGMSISGVRPGIGPLRDGRTIWVNFDGILAATVTNLIPNVFNQGPGTLDSNGEAVGKLDLSGFPKLGIVGHIIAVVIDSKAQEGLALITDPWVMRI